MTKPLVSVIIPAHNEAANIRSCLKAIAAQTNASRFETIVVDNASTDRTVKVVENCIATLPKANIRLLHEPTRGRGAARATGFAAARGQLLLSTDADTIVPAQWVATLTAQLQADDCVAVTGICRIEDCSPATNRTFNFAMPVFQRGYRIIMGHWWLTGSNFGIKRVAYLKSGGFDRTCRDMDDIELGWRVCRVGRIKHLPKSITVTTAGKRFRRGVFRGLFPYFKAYAGRFWLHQGDRLSRPD